METENFIPAAAYCAHYQLGTDFINALEKHGLIDVKVVDNTVYLQRDQLLTVETYRSFYYDLDVNFEGIEVIHHLLDKIHTLQADLQSLQNQLSRYT